MRVALHLRTFYGLSIYGIPKCCGII